MSTNTSQTRVEAPPPTLLYVVKQVELAVRACLDQILAPVGLTALQYTALTVLERHPDLTSAQLARNSFVTPQTMADMVVTLVDRGLVVRHRDQIDRRRLVLALTAQARELLEVYGSKVADLEAQMVAPLTQRQAAQLRASLSACRGALEITRRTSSPHLRIEPMLRNHRAL